MMPQLDERGDYVCEHGPAVDVHCCNCHSGFLFTPEDCVCGWPVCSVCDGVAFVATADDEVNCPECDGRGRVPPRSDQ